MDDAARGENVTHGIVALAWVAEVGEENKGQ